MEYYARPRQTVKSSHSTSASSPPELQELTVGEDTLAAAFESSIYLFPSPPSAPPSPAPSYSRASTSSIPFSLSLSRERSPTQSSSATGILSAGGGDWEDVGTPLSFRPSDAGSLFPDSDELELGRNDWDWSPLDEVEASMLEEEIVRASRWEMAAALRRRVDSLADAEARRRAQQHLQEAAHRKPNVDRGLDVQRPLYLRSRTTSAATSYGSASTPGPTPHPRIHLPLLSFFASFLSLDSSTLHLLSHTPSQSILFPGVSSSIVGESPEVVDETARPHGMESLLAPPSERISLKEGVDVACDQNIVSLNPFLASPVSLTNVVEMVKLLWRAKRWQTIVWGSS